MGRPSAREAASSPGSFAGLVERLSPTVVDIQVTKVAPTAGSLAMPAPEGPYGEFFRRLLPERMPGPQPHRLQASGSRVIIGRDGYILTDRHVVGGAQEVTVTMADHQTYRAQAVGRAAKTDLAVLKIDAGRALPVAPWAAPPTSGWANWAVAIGNPFGPGHTVTAGIVSAKGRVIGAGPYDDFIQTDAPINPGNSGGPLFSVRGEIVGINAARVAAGQGIGFAIPVDLVKPLIPQLEKTGAVRRGSLGVSVQSLTPELARSRRLEGRQGALVAEVMPGRPADKAGLRRGEVIVGFNGEAVKDAHDLPAVVARTPIGQEATVTLYRDGTTQEVRVTAAGCRPRGERRQRPASGACSSRR
jgi:serine protease Do